MKKPLLFLLLGILITGCGMQNEQSTNRSGNKKEIVAGDVIATLTKTSPLICKYQLKNQTEEVVTLELTSSQRFDYSVKTNEGKEVFLYSSVASGIKAR